MGWAIAMFGTGVSRMSLIFLCGYSGQGNTLDMVDQELQKHEDSECVEVLGNFFPSAKVDPSRMVAMFLIPMSYRLAFNSWHHVKSLWSLVNTGST
jgi:hypothetical protein